VAERKEKRQKGDKKERKVWMKETGENTAWK